MKLNEFALMEERAAAFGEAGAFVGFTFAADNGKVKQMEAARSFAAHFAELETQGLGLIFWGMPGGGKTFAAACIANALIETGVSVRMATMGDILNKLPALSAPDKLFYLDGLKTCGLLILDDLGMERRTDYAREQVFSIIDGRYLSKRPMIITTNLSLQHMKTSPDLADRRIFDRVLEVCVPVCFDSESLRREKARENLKKFKQIAGV